MAGGPVERGLDRPVCLVGAGSSGLAAARALAEREIPFEGFELGSDVGGIWRYGNDSGRSPAYASLRTNTSRHRTAYRAFPAEGPNDFIGHGELLDYLERFADAFDLRTRFRFRTEVVSVTPAGALGGAGAGESRRARADETGAPEDPAFDVRVRDASSGEERTGRYRAVIVASGHHWDPRLPEWADAFEGDLLHSRGYRSPTEPADLRGRRVMVVGIGNSACDIACELAGACDRVILSTRRSAHVLPKHLLGRPIDRWVTPLSSRLPPRWQALAVSLLVRLARGDQRRFGIPRPAHDVGQEHPTLSGELPGLVAEGGIEVRRDIRSVEGRTVRFADGAPAELDAIVCATGYHVSFPFLDDSLLDLVDPRPAGAPPRRGGRVAGNRVRLYRHVVPPESPGLYFVGLVQPLGAIPPLAEIQGEWIADLIEGTGALPTREEMREAVRETEAELASRYVGSPRHTLEVDFFPYRRAIARERRRSRRRRRRARRAGLSP